MTFRLCVIVGVEIKTDRQKKLSLKIIACIRKSKKNKKNI